MAPIAHPNKLNMNIISAKLLSEILSPVSFIMNRGSQVLSNNRSMNVKDGQSRVSVTVRTIHRVPLKTK